MIKKRIHKLSIALIISLFVTPYIALASQSFSLSPLIVDEKAKPRDILKQTAVLTNNTERKVTIYVTVQNLDNVEGEQAFEHYSKAEMETSLANWVEITRSVIELEPGETKRVPYLIQVHLNAIPGLYHAKIFFQEGSNRGEAQSRIKTWQAIELNIEVLDDAKERLQLGSFAPDKVFFTGKRASFSYLLENIGNRSVEPRGEIRIFNRRGEEVGTLPANVDKTSLLPEATSQLGSVWDAAGKFGRYKAYLDIEYGDKQLGVVNDTIYFWIIPWKQILLLFLGLAISVVVAGYIAYDKYGFNKKPSLAYVESEEQNPSNFNKKPISQAVVSKQRQQPTRSVIQMAEVQATKVTKKHTRETYGHPVGQATRLQPRQRNIQQPSGAVVSLKKRGN